MAVYEDSEGAAPGDDRLIEELVRFEHYVMKSSQVDVFAHMAELDLSITQLRALVLLLACSTEQAVHELAAALNLSVAATGRAVDVLARMGLVTRREDEVDRRVKRIAITAAGRETMREFASARREGLLRIVQMLDEDEREQLSAALRMVLANSEVREFERGYPPDCSGVPAQNAPSAAEHDAPAF